MPLVEVESSGGELLSLEDAKLHLGVPGSKHDPFIRQLIREAREYCEQCTQRTLRPLVTRWLVAPCWAAALGYLRWPPVREVSSVSYYPADGSAAVTVDPSEYRLIPSGDAVALLEWAGDSLPATAKRSDAVTVEFVTGYGSPEAIPEAARAAVKLQMRAAWGTDENWQHIRQAELSADRLLGPLTVGHYS